MLSICSRHSGRVYFRDFHEIPLSATAPKERERERELSRSSQRKLIPRSRILACPRLKKNEAQPAKWKGDNIGVASFVIQKIIYNYIYNYIIPVFDTVQNFISFKLLSPIIVLFVKFENLYFYLHYI